MKKFLNWFVKENTFLTRDYMDFGWGNGYVIIPKGHPCHGMHYDEIHDKFEIDVNGGLTFSDKASNISSWKYIDGVDGNDWIVGFDTAHSWDTLDMWPKEMVEFETKKLAKQLSEIKLKHL